MKNFISNSVGNIKENISYTKHNIQEIVCVVGTSVFLILGSSDVSRADDHIEQAIDPLQRSVQNDSMKRIALKYPQYYNVVRVQNDPRLTQEEKNIVSSALVISYKGAHNDRLLFNSLKDYVPGMSGTLDSFERIFNDGESSFSSKTFSPDPIRFQQELLGLPGIGENKQYIIDTYSVSGKELEGQITSLGSDDPALGELSSHYIDGKENSALLQLSGKDSSLGIGNVFGSQEFINEANMARSESPIVKEVINQRNKIFALEKKIQNAASKEDIADLKKELQHTKNELKGYIDEKGKEIQEDITKTLRDEIVPQLKAEFEQMLKDNTPVYIGGRQMQSEYKSKLKDYSTIGNAFSQTLMLFGDANDQKKVIAFQTSFDGALTTIDSFNNIADIMNSTEKLSSLADIASMAASFSNILGSIGAISSVFGGGDDGEKKMWEQVFKMLNALIEGQKAIMEKLDVIDQRQQYILEVVVDIKKSMDELKRNERARFEQLSREHGYILQALSIGDYSILQQIHSSQIDNAFDEVKFYSNQIKHDGEGNIEPLENPAFFSELESRLKILSEKLDKAPNIIIDYEKKIASLGEDGISETERLRLQNTIREVADKQTYFRTITEILPQICKDLPASCEFIEDIPEVNLLFQHLLEISKIVEQINVVEQGEEVIMDSQLMNVVSKLLQKHERTLDAMEKIFPQILKQYSNKLSEIRTKISNIDKIGMDIIFSGDDIRNSKIGTEVEEYSVNGYFRLIKEIEDEGIKWILGWESFQKMLFHITDHDQSRVMGLGQGEIKFEGTKNRGHRFIFDGEGLFRKKILTSLKGNDLSIKDFPLITSKEEHIYNLTHLYLIQKSYTDMRLYKHGAYCGDFYTGSTRHRLPCQVKGYFFTGYGYDNIALLLNELRLGKNIDNMNLRHSRKNIGEQDRNDNFDVTISNIVECSDKKDLEKCYSLILKNIIDYQTELLKMLDEIVNKRSNHVSNIIDKHLHGEVLDGNKYTKSQELKEALGGLNLELEQLENYRKAMSVFAQYLDKAGRTEVSTDIESIDSLDPYNYTQMSLLLKESNLFPDNNYLRNILSTPGISYTEIIKELGEKIKILNGEQDKILENKNENK